METAKTDSALERLLTRLGLRKSHAADDIDPSRYADDAGRTVDEATEALGKSITSILADADVTDKPGAIQKSLAQFRGYLDDNIPEQIERAMRDVAKTMEKDKDDMATLDEVQAQNAALVKQLADAQAEIAKAKVKPAHADAFKAMSEAKQQAYLAADADAQDAMCKRDDAGDTQLAKALAETEDLRKRIASFEEARELQAFQKRAADIGLPESQADTLLKASKGDEKAFSAMLDVIKAQNAQIRTGGVFKEFGSTGGTAPGGGQAHTEVEALAATLVKADPKLSLAAARVQVRKMQPELAQRERDDERAAVRLAAV